MVATGKSSVTVNDEIDITECGLPQTGGLRALRFFVTSNPWGPSFGVIQRSWELAFSTSFLNVYYTEV